MNAEFLEKYIVITSETETVENVATTTYAAEPVRKNLAPISFIGAIVELVDHTEAYAIASAVSDGTEIEIAAGPYTLTYTIATGEFEVTKE